MVFWKYYLRNKEILMNFNQIYYLCQRFNLFTGLRDLVVLKYFILVFKSNL